MDAKDSSLDREMAKYRALLPTLADKNSRIDSGKATEAHVVVNLEFDNNG